MSPKAISEYAKQQVGLTEAEFSEVLNHPAEHRMQWCPACEKFERYLSIKTILVKWEKAKTAERNSR